MTHTSPQARSPLFRASTQITPARFTGPHRLDGADRDETVDPFPIGETPGRAYIRPHRLAQLVPGSFTEHETIRAIRRRLSRPAWHVRIGRRIADSDGFDHVCVLIAGLCAALFVAATVSAAGAAL